MSGSTASRYTQRQEQQQQYHAPQQTRVVNQSRPSIQQRVEEKRVTFGHQNNEIQFSSDQPVSHTLLNSQTRPSIRREFEGRVVSETTGQSHLVEEKEGQKRVISTQMLQPKIIEERVTMGQGKVVSEVEMKKERVSQRSKEVVHNVDVEYVKRDKIVEIVTEKPV